MPSDDEPVKHEVKQYKPCQEMMNQWSMKWDNTNMPSNYEPVKQEVKQYKPWQVTMNQWSMTWDNINHAK